MNEIPLHSLQAAASVQASLRDVEAGQQFAEPGGRAGATAG